MAADRRGMGYVPRATQPHVTRSLQRRSEAERGDPLQPEVWSQHAV